MKRTTRDFLQALSAIAVAAILAAISCFYFAKLFTCPLDLCDYAMLFLGLFIVFGALLICLYNWWCTREMRKSDIDEED